MKILLEIARHQSEYWKRKLETHEQEYERFFRDVNDYESITQKQYPRDQIDNFYEPWLKQLEYFSEQLEIFKAWERSMKGIG